MTIKSALSNLLIFIAKYLIGWWYIYLIIWFRAYARSVVYNGVLQFNLPLKRLREREPAPYWTEKTPTMMGSDRQFYGWILKDIHGTGKEGVVKFRNITRLQFYLVVFFIWGWIDDDSNEDTTDIGYVNTISVGAEGYRTNNTDRTHDLVGYFYGWLLPKFKQGNVVYGSAFDLGDVRAQYPFFKFWCTWVWNNRNRAMNFQYLFLDY